MVLSKLRMAPLASFCVTTIRLPASTGANATSPTSVRLVIASVKLSLRMSATLPRSESGRTICQLLFSLSSASVGRSKVSLAMPSAVTLAREIVRIVPSPSPTVTMNRAPTSPAASSTSVASVRVIMVVPSGPGAEGTMPRPVTDPTLVTVWLRSMKRAPSAAVSSLART